MAGFDFQGARNAGYSDQEIVDHLESDPSVKFDIKGALSAGYTPSDIVTHLSGGEVQPAQSTSYWDALRQGAANVLGGTGETLNEYVGDGTGDKLTAASKDIAPENYQPAKVVGKGGSITQLPRAVVESAPGMATSIAAARAMPGPTWLKLLAGSGAYALQTLGNRAKQRAVNNTGNPDAVPTTSDKVAAAASEVPEALIGTVGLNRFLPGSGRVASVGARGVLDAAKEWGQTALTEGAASGAQNAVAQLGATLGTKAGANINPEDVANSAIVGGATGGVLAGPRAVVDATGSVKYADFGRDKTDATASVANDIVRNAQGIDNLKPTFFNSRGSAAYDAVSRSQSENNLVLKQQLADLKQTTPLTPEAQTALDVATSGKPLTQRDLDAIDKETAGAPNGNLVQFLARKASVLAQLQEKGIYHPEAGTFTGGLSNRFTHILSGHNIGKTALVGMLGASAAEGGGHLIAYSPEMLGATAAAFMGARGLDRLTGNLSPAYRFADRFADPTVQAPSVAQAPQPPAPPNVQNGPWGPRPVAPPVPQVAPKSNGPLTQPPSGFSSLLQTAVRAQNKQTRAQQQQFKSQAMPLLARLAAKEAVKHGASILGEAVAGPIGGHIAHGVASILAELHERGLEGPTSPVPQAPGSVPEVTQKVAAGPLGPGGVPVSVLTRTKALTRGLQAMDKLKQTQQGQDYANTVAAKSPLLAKIGGPTVVANPAAGARMAQMVSAANAYNRLMTGASSVLDKGPTTELSAKAETPHPGGTSDQWPPKPKANGKAADEYAVPSSPYAHLSPKEAADAIARDAEKAGNVKYINGFRSATMRNITAIRNAALGVAREVPTIDGVELAKQFEGVSSRKQAIVHRNWLIQHHPEAKAALDVYFSDEVIDRIWKRKG